MKLVTRIARELDLRPDQTAAAIELLDEGNTVPFIARYRKEITRGLDEDHLRQLRDLLKSLRALDKRRQVICDSIADQGHLTPELHSRLLAAKSLTALEDLYQPFKPKRRTRAGIAREKGLQGLAELIVAQRPGPNDPVEIARPYVTGEVTTTEEAYAGARDIVAEMISDHPQVRHDTREKGMRWAMLLSSKIESAEDPRGVYRIYYDFQLRVERLRPHQVLALNRGEAEKVLRINIEVPERDWKQAVTAVFHSNRRYALNGQLEQAIEDAAKRLLLPAIERDVRRSLTERAEVHGIEVFAENLRSLLTQPPLVGLTILGIDPGYRSGCKLAVIDPTGRVLDTGTIFPHAPQKRWTAALEKLAQLVSKYDVDLVAIGNGTASRETEKLAAELIQTDRVATSSATIGSSNGLRYLMVNEAGASVYSASSLAREELPELDVTLRGAVSIARRAQDPLAELVKIDPRSIGVGLYQHDLNQTKLAESLDGVVEQVVNHVGVDVNTASLALLTHIAGIGLKLAENIVTYRNERGPFASRRILLQVPGMGPRTFEQAAGFLRIHDGDEPLDGSAIHPESYGVAEEVLSRAGLTMGSSPADREQALAPWNEKPALAQLARELDIGEFTLADILEQLIRPGRDPRSDLPPPILRSDVLSMSDLRPGMRLRGTVRNVVDFGAFVDIGVKQDGLLHRSQWPTDPGLDVGQVIEVTILKVEPERGRISLGWPG